MLQRSLHVERSIRAGSVSTFGDFVFRGCNDAIEDRGILGAGEFLPEIVECEFPIGSMLATRIHAYCSDVRSAWRWNSTVTSLIAYNAKLAKR
jgi:hypothetical protein